MSSPSKQPKRYQFEITLTPFEYHLLGIWATNHGLPAATFAAQIIAQRLEANFGWSPQQWNEKMNEYYKENNIE